MAMAADGGRRQILGGGKGFGLAFKAEALWVGTRTKAATRPGGNLDSTKAAVSRMRTAIEGSQSMTITKRMALTRSIEMRIRQDGGDAETGRGMDLGAGLALADGVCCRARGTEGNWTRVDRKMLWSPAASSSQQRARVLTDVKARRFAPPRSAGLTALTSAPRTARPAWLLPTMPTHTPPTCWVAVLSRITPFPATVDT